MFLSGQHFFFYSSLTLLAFLATSFEVTAASPDQQSEPGKETVHKGQDYVDNQLPLSGMTTMELQNEVNKGNYMAALQLALYWRLKVDGGKNMSLESIEANYQTQKWLEKAQPSDHPVVALYQAVQHENSKIWDAQGTLPQNVQQTLEDCKTLARQGNFEAIEALSNLIQPDEQETRLWVKALKRKVEQDHNMEAAAQLANLCLFSIAGNTQDPQIGLYYAELAAKANNIEGMFILGKALRYGMGDSDRTDEGIQWLQKAAQLGHVNAIKILLNDVHLADETQESQDIVRQEQEWEKLLCKRGQVDTLVARGLDLIEQKEHLNEGVVLLQRAADQDSFEAIEALAQYYEELSHNTPEDENKAALEANKAYRLAEKLAEKGGVQGMIRLAEYYERGFGTAKDFGKTIEWLQKASAMDSQRAKIKYARCLLNGIGGKVDKQKAFDLLSEVKEDAPDTPDLDFMLGYMYEEGFGDTPPNLAAACKYYTQGAEKGDSRAMNNLASMYETGSGMKKDLDQALKWYKKSAELGNKDAQINLKRLKSINNISVKIPEN